MTAARAVMASAGCAAAETPSLLRHLDGDLDRGVPGGEVGDLLIREVLGDHLHLRVVALAVAERLELLDQIKLVLAGDGGGVGQARHAVEPVAGAADRKSTRLNSSH